MSTQHQQMSSSGYSVMNETYQVNQYEYDQQYGRPMGMQQQFQYSDRSDTSGHYPMQIKNQLPQNIQVETLLNQYDPRMQYQSEIQNQNVREMYNSQPQGRFYDQTQPAKFPEQIRGNVQAQTHDVSQRQFKVQEQFQEKPKSQHEQRPTQKQPRPFGIQQPSSDQIKEWPPKNATGPNLTTTYPSGFKLKDELQMSQEAPQVREFIRPKKQCKDYAEFFAQNALPNNYPSYRAPPGTQHFNAEDEEYE